MTQAQFYYCVNETKKHDNRNDYISAVCLSPIWGGTDAPEPGEIPGLGERVAEVGEVWDICNRGFKEIAAAAGMSARKLAERFCIPHRTAESWCMGERVPPLYVSLMIQECLGLINR